MGQELLSKLQFLFVFCAFGVAQPLALLNAVVAPFTREFLVCMVGHFNEPIAHLFVLVGRDGRHLHDHGCFCSCGFIGRWAEEHL